MFKSLNFVLDFMAKPKSAILGIFFFDKNMFEIFISLCMIEFLDNYSNPL